MARILVPLPDRDFDTTEVAIPWAVLRAAGHSVHFATERGAVPETDPLLLTGVIFGQLGALDEAKARYAELREDPAFLHPTPWDDVDASAYDGLWLAGGHAQGMRQYLESERVREIVRAMWTGPVAAICHGVIVAARAGVLRDRRTTCLPRFMEQAAWMLTAWKLGNYYRTYPEWVEAEVRATGCRFERGPLSVNYASPFVVEDGLYLSGRWPGDSAALAQKFVAVLDAHSRPGTV